MAKTSEHGRIIAAAAKAALLPLGCRRKGQSRLWISDHGCWAILIEFQPSGWEKGTYLNLGAKWLWYRFGKQLAHDRYRFADFIRFESPEQFGPEIVGMAASAAREVLALREQFRTLVDINRHLQGRITQDGLPVFLAAVSSGLIGDKTTSRRLFERMEAWAPIGLDWQRSLKSDAARLAAQLDDPDQFRTAVMDIVNERRQRLGLSPSQACLEQMMSIT
jgi:hypothetical protein